MIRNFIKSVRTKVEFWLGYDDGDLNYLIKEYLEKGK